MNNYRHLSQVQRYHIEALLKAGLSQTAIAKQLAVHRSTISREIRRNSSQAALAPDKYKATDAQLCAQSRSKKS